MRRRWFVPLVCTLTLSLGAVAAAHAGPGGRPGGVGRGGLGGLLSHLISPCPAACGDTARECVEAADAAAVACIADACSGEVATAQTACADERFSETCRGAIADLRECGSDCLDTRHTSLQVCREAFSDCRDACAAAE